MGLMIFGGYVYRPSPTKPAERGAGQPPQWYSKQCRQIGPG